MSLKDGHYENMDDPEKRRFVYTQGKFKGLSIGLGPPRKTNVVGANPNSIDWCVPPEDEAAMLFEAEDDNQILPS